MFNLTQAEDVVKVALTLQAIPLAKQGPFNNITDWATFKTKLIEEFGSIDIFGRDVNQVFNLLSLSSWLSGEISERMEPESMALESMELESTESESTKPESKEPESIGGLPCLVGCCDITG